MDSSKIKTVVLLILLAVNLAFGAILLADGFRSAGVEAQAREELVEVLQANGIEMDEQAIAKRARLSGYRLTRDGAAEQALVEALLGPAEAEDRGGNIFYYENENGWARFHASGEFELSTHYEPGSDLTALAESWIARMNLTVDRASQVIQVAGETRSVSYTCRFDEGVLYNCALTLRFGAAGELEISGRWPFAQMREQSREELLSPSTVLIRFLSELRAGGVVCRRIDGMEQGWMLSASATEGELIPVWEIRTDGGSFYLDARSGARLTEPGL